MNVLVKIFFVVNFFNGLRAFCPVHVTISSVSPTIKNSTLFLSWDPKCKDLPTKIRIYSENPYLMETPAISEINPQYFKAGRADTNVGLNNLKLPSQWDIKTYQESSKEITINENAGTCLNYFVLSFNKTNHVINFDCLKINPQWMSNTKNIWQFPLKDLMIPGSKSSGCYVTNRNSKVKHLKNESFHQNVDIWHQLVLGVRYLDFSVGYFRSFHKLLDVRSRFWVFNEEHEISPIFPILEDVLKFVEVSKEIVILDFRHFAYGFHETTGAHEIFKKLLQNMFGHIAAVNNEKYHREAFDFTIQQLKNASKHILILYNSDDLKVKNEQNEIIMWPAWKRREIQTDENVVKELSSEISTKYRTDNNNGWILTLNYTKGNTDRMNSQILSSLTGPWSARMNVISLDYVLSSSLIDVCLEVNSQKALAKRNFVIIDL